jgi:hypothetical protein
MKSNIPRATSDSQQIEVVSNLIALYKEQFGKNWQQIFEKTVTVSVDCQVHP